MERDNREQDLNKQAQKKNLKYTILDDHTHVFLELCSQKIHQSIVEIFTS